MNAIVNKIIPFSSVDGPGNRCVIFFQGCNINCGYCHNPETINLCNHCGICIEECPVGALRRSEDGKVQWDESKCVDCDKCIKACERDSSPKGKSMSVEELVKEISKYASFIQGITVSGGEAGLRWEFLSRLFKLTKSMGLSNFIDTNGTVPLWDKKELLDYTDKVMIDMKSFDQEESILITGSGNINVKKNVQMLGKVDKVYEVRTVIVPEVMDYTNTVRNTAQLISSIDKEIRYKIIKFRTHGVREKYKKFSSPTDETMNELKKIAQDTGCKKVIVL